MSQPAKKKLRRKMCAKKSAPNELPTETKNFPFISTKVKASFADYISR